MIYVFGLERGVPNSSQWVHNWKPKFTMWNVHKLDGVLSKLSLELKNKFILQTQYLYVINWKRLDFLILKREAILDEGAYSWL